MHRAETGALGLRGASNLVGCDNATWSTRVGDVAGNRHPSVVTRQPDHLRKVDGWDFEGRVRSRPLVAPIISRISTAPGYYSGILNGTTRRDSHFCIFYFCVHLLFPPETAE